MVELYPSLIAAPQLQLPYEIERLAPHCAGFHLDIMDGHFVPTITWGPLLVNALATIARHVWVHLMVDKPYQVLEQIELPTKSIVSIHLESSSDIEQCITYCKKKGWRSSLALNPTTEIKTIIPWMAQLDQILIMAVAPGKSGQQFLPTTFERLRFLADHRAAQNLSCTIGVDGGVTSALLPHLRDWGCDQAVVGAAIFSTPDPVATLIQLKKAN